MLQILVSFSYIFLKLHRYLNVLGLIVTDKLYLFDYVAIGLFFKPDFLEVWAMLTYYCVMNDNYFILNYIVI